MRILYFELPWVPEVIFFRLKEGNYAAKPLQRGAKRREEKNNLWSHEPGTSFPCEKSVQELNRVVDWFDKKNNNCDWIVKTAAPRGTLWDSKPVFVAEIGEYANKTTIMAGSEEENDFSRSFQNAVRYALDSKFKEIQNLKPVQEEALFKFIQRNDVFSVLPTGCGKSLIFQLVPIVCSYLHDQGFKYPKNATLVVVCPLSALIESHIQELADHGIAACSLGDAGLLDDDIPKHSIVFTSPELIVREEKWRKLLQSKEVQENLFGLVTDEAHVVPKW